MEDWSFDTLAGALRAASRDLSTFHEVLADKLTQALPAGAVILRHGGFPFQKTKRPVVHITVTLGDQTFTADHAHGEFEYRIAKIVRGIALKTEPAMLDRWLHELTQALWEHAQASESARTALEQFLL
ncbi:MAG: hypothetical protein M0Z54_00895 [Thermaerobacter sp.]|nr:hypothetical protein [Thermaerobacter sp.]